MAHVRVKGKVLVPDVGEGFGVRIQHKGSSS